MENLSNGVKILLKLMRWDLCLMAMISVFIGAAIDGFRYLSTNLLLAMVVVFLVTAGGMAFNDYLDWEIDKYIHPERAIPSGKVSPKSILKFAIAIFLISLSLSFIINIICFGIVATSILLLFLYEKFFKNQGLVGNISVAFLSSMTFVFGGASIGKIYNASILSIMTFLLMLGREILMDVRDIKGDVLRRTTLPMKFGKKYSVYLGCIFLIAALALVPIPFIFGILNIGYIIIAIPVYFLIIYAISISLKNIKNIGKATDIMKIVMAIALIGFIVGIIPF